MAINQGDKGRTIKPFYCVEPRQTKRLVNPVNYITILKDKIENGVFHGVKLYSPVGFSPTDPVLYDNGGVYEYCVEHSTPITAHNSDAGFATFALQVEINGHIYNRKSNALERYDNKLIEFEYDVISPKAGKAIPERADALNHPKLWEKVLERYSDLTLNLAHFGGSGALMELVHHTIPEDMEKFTSYKFKEWLSTIPPEYKSKVLSFYHVPNANTSYYRLKDIFYPHTDDLPGVAMGKENLREDFWELLFSLGKINNWSRYILDLIESDKYPNLYTDLSAYSEGKVFHFEVPRKLCTLSKKEYRSIRKRIIDDAERELFEKSYKKVAAFQYGLDEDILYKDHVKLVVTFKKIDELDPHLTHELNVILRCVNEVTNDDELVDYLVDNEKFSILLDLNAFKEKLYDKLLPRHQAKILYGSDFYFTQVFGPRHEQYVQDFVNVFDAEFKDIAQKNSGKFLGL